MIDKYQIRFQNIFQTKPVFLLPPDMIWIFMSHFNACRYSKPDIIIYAITFYGHCSFYWIVIEIGMLQIDQTFVSFALFIASTKFIFLLECISGCAILDVFLIDVRYWPWFLHVLKNSWIAHIEVQNRTKIYIINYVIVWVFYFLCCLMFLW